MREAIYHIFTIHGTFLGYVFDSTYDHQQHQGMKRIFYNKKMMKPTLIITSVLLE